MTTRIDDCLMHPNRAKLHAIVCEDPGIGFRELVTRSGIATGTTRHHLTILERHGLVREFRFDGFLVLMPAGDKRNPMVLALLREPGLSELVEAVKRLGCPSQTEVMACFPDWPRPTVQHRLERLVRGRVLSFRLQGAYKRYSVSVAPSHADVAGDLERLRAAAYAGPAAFYQAIDSIARATSEVLA